MRIAYADPPYIGQARRHYGEAEVDYESLIKDLLAYDGWGLSCTSSSLAQLLPLCPPDTRVGAWVKPFAFFHRGTRGHPPYAWEPVIFMSARPRERTPHGVRDWVCCNAFGTTPAERTWGKEKGVVGIKPPDFCVWLFGVLGLRVDDIFVDLFPGSGMVMDQWRKYKTILLWAQ